MAVLSRHWLFCAGDTCRQCHPVEMQTEEEDQTPPAPRLGASDDEA